MDFSVGMLEFPHIAEGYKNIDYIMKHFSISTLKLQRICPGRLLFIFSADTSDVVNIIKEYTFAKNLTELNAVPFAAS